MNPPSSLPLPTRYLLVAWLSVWQLATGGEAPAATRLQNLANMSLEQLAALEVDVVYGASKREQKTWEAPSSVSLITREDIRQHGYRTLADVLRDVRGVYVSNDRSYGFVGVRGMSRPGDYGTALLVTVDGHRINEPIYDSAFNGQELPISLDLIERVEVIRGPGSALYGSNAFFGVVNLVTRRGAAADGLATSAEIASLDTSTGSLTYGRQFANGLDVLFSGTIFDSRGDRRLYFPEFQDVNGGIAEDLDAERARRYYARLSYRDFTLTGVYGRRFKEVPTAAYDAVFNEPFEITDTRGYLEFKFDRRLPEDWRVSASALVDYFQETAYQSLAGDTATAPVSTVSDTAAARWWGLHLQASKAVRRHHVVGGIETRRDYHLNQRSYDVDSGFEYINNTTANHSLGVFLQDEWRMHERVLLNVGARYDHYSSFGETVNPRGSLIVSPAAGRTLKLIYGQAYRAPNEYEVAYDFDHEGSRYLGNRDLKPETVKSYEAVWEQELSPVWRVAAAVFQNETADAILQQDESADPAVGGYIFRNLDSTKVTGAEVEIEGRGAGGLRGRASYAYADGREKSGNEWLANSPRHVAKLGAVVPVWRDRLDAAFEVQGLSRRRTARLATTVPGYALVNLTLSTRKLLPGLEASLRISNLLDREYEDTVGPDYTQDAVRQRGRTLHLKLTYRY